MSFSYNLNTYSHHQLKQWLTILYRNQLLEESINNHFLDKALFRHYPLNNHSGFLKLAAGIFFNSQHDFQFLLPGDLMQALASGMDTEEILAITHNKHYYEKSINIFSPLHFFNEAKHILATSGIKSHHAAAGAGLARSLKIYESEGIVVCPLPRQALTEGIVFEAILAADREMLPVLYIIHDDIPENNHDYADIFGRLNNTYLSYCDNTNFFDTINATRKAYRLVKEEQLPVILTGKGTLSGEQMFDLFTDSLIETAQFSKEEIRQSGEDVRTELHKANRIIESLNEPVPAGIIRKTTKGYDAQEQPPEEHHEAVTLSHAISATISEQLEKYHHSFYLSFLADSNSHEEHLPLQITYTGPKMLTTNTTPELLVAMAGGMCYYKEHMRIIALPAADASCLWTILNQLTEMVFLTWKTRQNIHMLLRIPVNGYDGSGPFLSQKTEAALLALPGIRIVYPAFADDAAGLIRTAMQSPGITVMLESKALYEDALAAAPVHPHHEVGLGSARLAREGNDITLITYGNTVHLAIRAAEKIAAEYNLQAEVVDIRSILPIDKSTILRSIQKTHRALVVSEGYIFSGVVAEIAAMVSQEAYTMLEAPVGRVGAVFTPIPYQKEAETMVLPSVSGIIDEALDILEY